MEKPARSVKIGKNIGRLYYVCNHSLLKNAMEKREKLVQTALKFASGALLAVVCLFCSCQEIVTTSPEDYIGPAVKPAEPNLGIPAAAPSAIVEIEPNGPLNITIDQAVIISLEKNKSLLVQKLNPQLSRTFEQQALAAFDPDFTAAVSKGKSRAESMPRPGLGSFSVVTKTLSAEAVLSQYLPTGTTVSLNGSTESLDGSFVDEPFISSRLGIDVTQPLLRGFGTTVNLVAVNQAKIDTKISQYELRGFVETLVAQVEETYWNYLLAQRSIDIYQQSLRIAEQQQKETEERIKVGALATSELVAARAEVALRKQNLIVAQNTLDQTRLNLVRLLNPGTEKMWNRQISLTSEPQTPAVELGPVETHVARGMQMRPEMNQARLLINRDELDVVKTRNGLLPQLDLFITMGKTGYADSFNESARNIFKKNYDVLAGISLEYPPINRSARAQHQQAKLSRQQAHEALDNLAQLVEVDIRGAYIQITSAQEQVAAAKASRELQKEKLRVETEKYNVGKSTYLLVAQAQRDFLQSQLTEIQAIIGFQLAVVELHRLEGTLLLQSGLSCPGNVPIKTSEYTSS
jgi:outer membrane protein